MVGTSQLISTAEMVSITDAMAQAYEVLNPYLGDGSGTLTGGYWGNQVLGRVVGRTGTYYGVADRYKHLDLDAGAQQFADALLSSSLWGQVVSGIVNGLQSNINKYGRYLSGTVTTLDSYASYCNAITPNSMMFASGFAKLYYYFRSQTDMLSAGNVLATKTNLCSGTVTGSAAVTFTDGIALNTVSTLTSGAQGYAPDSIELLVTSGTLTGTITATGIDQNGTSAAWTATVTSMTSTGTAVQLTNASSKRTGNITALSYSGNGVAASFNIRTISRDTSQ